MTKQMNDLVKNIATQMSGDADTIKGVFDEFKTEVEPRRARGASRQFNENELEILRPDYGSAIDSILKKR